MQKAEGRIAFAEKMNSIPTYQIVRESIGSYRESALSADCFPSLSAEFVMLQARPFRRSL
jgi:hypothetical protein